MHNFEHFRATDQIAYCSLISNEILLLEVGSGHIDVIDVPVNQIYHFNKTMSKIWEKTENDEYYHVALLIFKMNVVGSCVSA